MLPDLEHIGFTRNQANVYAALLRSGRSTIQQLATATGLNRVTVHSIVEKFEALQLCCSVRDGKARSILPLDPVCLEFRLQQESAMLAGKQEAYRKLKERLHHAYRHSQRDSQLLNLRGPNMYRYLVEDAFSTGEETWEFLNADLIPAEALAFLRETVIPRKHRLRIPSRYILTDTPRGRELFKEFYLDWPNAAPAEPRFLADPEVGFRTQVVIYATTVALLNIEQDSVVLIKDPEICNSTRQLFLFFWHKLAPNTSGPSR